MAFTSGLNLNVRNGGADGTTGNGGGFDTGATFDTGLTATSANMASPVVHHTSYTFVAGDVGDWVFIQAGSNWIPGWYKIASVAGGDATLDAAIGHASLYPGNSLNTVAGCASTASPTGGTWAIDYSQNDSPSITYSDLSAAGAGSTFTSVLNPFTIAQIGNIIAVSGGANCTVQRAMILSLSGITATLDKAVTSGVATVGAGKLGGGLKTPGQAGALQIGGSNVWWQYNATPFNVTSTSSNVTNGRVILPTGSLSRPSKIRGYDQTYGDETTNRPTMKWGVNALSNPLIGFATGNNVENVILSGDRVNGWTATVGIIISTNPISHFSIRRVKFTSFVGNALSMQNATLGLFVIDCEVTDCTGGQAFSLGGTSPVDISDTNFHDNTGNAILLNQTSSYRFTRCIFDTNLSGSTKSGISATAGLDCVVDSCVFYNSGASGINITVAGYWKIIDSVFESNGLYGINFPAGDNNGVTLINCAFYNNTSGNYNVTNLESRGEINQSAGTFFVDAPNMNFAPNATAGQGALIRGVSYPSSKRDIGAVQHADPVIVFPAAGAIYAGKTGTTDGATTVTGTLHASNIASAAAANANSNLSAGVLASGTTVDDVVGSLAGGGGSMPIIGEGLVY